MPYLKKDGTIVCNTQKMDPMPVITGAAKYPEKVLDRVEAAGAKVQRVDALRLALEAGSPKAVNVALIGVLAKNTDIDREIWEETIKTTVPPKFVELNEKAFALGYETK